MSTKVAIVEDDAAFRRLLEQFINEAPGYQCVCSCDCAETALKRIPRLMPDVVLMDIHLPNLSGIECTAQLKQLAPQVPIIMLTVNADAERVFKALQAGARGYLLKRTAPEKLLPAIQEVLQGGAAMTGEIARKVVEFFQQPAPGRDAQADLSRREREVLELLSQGYNDREIAARLCISFETERTHLAHIFDKLQVRSRTAAVARYLGTTERKPTLRPDDIRPRPNSP
ncbi:MAG: response regulator transcription factor [Verrucomicrobia bacterium]|nr:response regulator transcription factor [Verrucomicrobiota bacterium]